MPKKTRDVIVASSDWTVPTADGVHRRTIVKGAAWTVPVVAVAVATPAAAASKTPTLAFTQATYTTTACGTIKGVQVKRTTDGTTPDAGKTVTVHLQDGYEFVGGARVYTATTDANGLITLPDIVAPAKGGTSNITATSDSLTATPATISAPAVGGSLYRYQDSEVTKLGATNVAQVVADGTNGVYAVTADGQLVDSAGNKIDSGLDPKNDRVLAIALGGGNTPIPYYIKDGKVYKYEGKEITELKATNVVKIIADGTGGVYGVTKDGNLVNTNDTVIATGLDATNDQGVTVALAGTTPVPYYIKDGVVYKYQDGAETKLGGTNVVKLVSNGTSDIYGVTSGGDLVTTSGTVITSGLDPDNDEGLVIAKGASGSVPYFLKDGNVYRYINGEVKQLDATDVQKLVSDGTGGVYGITNEGALVDTAGSEVTTGLKTGSDEALTIANASSGAAPYFIKAPTC